jgi:hypothetical protein
MRCEKMSYEAMARVPGGAELAEVHAACDCARANRNCDIWRKLMDQPSH